MSHGSRRQSDGQRSQGRGHARDTLHLQVTHCYTVLPNPTQTLSLGLTPGPPTFSSQTRGALRSVLSGYPVAFWRVDLENKGRNSLGREEKIR